MNLVYKRILLKLSGEALVGDLGYGIDPNIIGHTAHEIQEIHKLGIQQGIVIGGGNIFRGLSKNAKSIQRVDADHMGMLATVINSIALNSALQNLGIPSLIQSAIPISSLIEPLNIGKAINAMQQGKTVIFAGGTGNPYFTTDTAAALRASEIGADILIKATKVNGIYDSDPKTHENAKKIDNISYQDVILQNLRVMDITAISFSMENKIKVGIVNLLKKGDLYKFLTGEDKIGSLIS